MTVVEFTNVEIFYLKKYSSYQIDGEKSEIFLNVMKLFEWNMGQKKKKIKGNQIL